MKKLLILCFAISLTSMSIAQETEKQKEIGLVVYSFSSFGLTFKTGTSRSLWRYQILFITGNNTKDKSEELVHNQSNNSFGIQIGKEFRKVVIEHLEFRYGLDLSFRFRKSKDHRDYTSDLAIDRMYETTEYMPGLRFVLGVNYVIKDKFVIGAELLPHFTYTTGTRKDKSGSSDEEVTDISGFSYGISNGSALLSISYRF